MPSNRSYAGPHDAAELLIADGVYALVLNRDITDEQADALGYSTDEDEAAERGRPYARRTIAVSDALAPLLDESFTTYTDDEGNEASRPTWPSVGGAAGEPVDDPSSHTSIRNYELEDGNAVSADELNAIARAADDAAEAVIEPGTPDAAAAIEAERTRLAQAKSDALARLGGVQDKLKQAADLEEDDADALTAERTRLQDSIKALDAEIDELDEGGS